ncbi:hypothetical protein [Lentzea guizhouensis]|uniref:hypothetical protein n=1 Tax=Lentzea guizhouensis TaxID=1586287 RepID=UPI0012B68A5A|nr:hypothetical protein [Lentzea guizhouensis]
MDGVVSGADGVAEAIGPSAGGASGVSGVWVAVPVVVDVTALDGMGVGAQVPAVPSIETVAVEPKPPADATPAAMKPSSEMTSTVVIAPRRRVRPFTAQTPPISAFQGAARRCTDMLYPS